MDRQELREVLEEIFEERSRIDSETHCKHHAWLEERIARDRAVKELCWKISTAVVQWSVLGLVGGAWYWIQHGHWPH